MGGMRLILYALGLAFLAGFAIATRIAIRSFRGEMSDYWRTPSQEISKQPERSGIANLREISFAAPGEPRVSAWYAPGSNRAAIVLVHGTGADRSALLSETRLLAAAGFGVLALDLPGQGASEGRSHWGVPERHAIIAAADWLKDQAEVDPQRIGGYGFSMGAYVMSQAAVLSNGFRAVALAACPNDVVEQNWVNSRQWGLLTQVPVYLALRLAGQPRDMLPKDIVGKIAPRGLLLIGGTLDSTVPPYMAEQLFKAAGTGKELWMMEGAGHGDYLKVAPQEFPLKLADFYRRALKIEAQGSPL
jgi:dipeptidyl aminopeptidase/acylaminoacyl peptidase